VPCFIRWPGTLPAGRELDRITAHVDLTPTLLDLCRVRPPGNVRFDGRSVAPWLRGEKTAWPDRTLCFQWHRGDQPELYRAFAAINQPWMLVQASGATEGTFPPPSRFELFNLDNDPFEQNDLAAVQPGIINTLKAGYELWFKDVTGSRDFSVPPRIIIGSTRENPVLLSRQDWRGPDAGWEPRSVGRWAVQVADVGDYQVTLRFAPGNGAGTATFTLGQARVEKPIAAGQTSVEWGKVRLPAGPAWCAASRQQADGVQGAHYVELLRIR
jgi:hypothetical protein